MCRGDLHIAQVAVVIHPPYSDFMMANHAVVEQRIPRDFPIEKSTSLRVFLASIVPDLMSPGRAKKIMPEAGSIDECPGRFPPSLPCVFGRRCTSSTTTKLPRAGKGGGAKGARGEPMTPVLESSQLAPPGALGGARFDGQNRGPCAAQTRSRFE